MKPVVLTGWKSGNTSIFVGLGWFHGEILSKENMLRKSDAQLYSWKSAFLIRKREVFCISEI